MTETEFKVDRRIAEHQLKALREMLKSHIDLHKTIKNLPRLELHERKLWNQDGLIHFMVIDKISDVDDSMTFYVMADYNYIVGKSLPKKGWFSRLFLPLEHSFDYEKIDFFKVKVPPYYISLLENPTGVLEYKIFARTVYQLPAMQDTDYGMVSDKLATEVAKRVHEIKLKNDIFTFAKVVQVEAEQLHSMKDSYSEKRVMQKARLERKAMEELEPTKPKSDEKKDEGDKK